MNRKLTYLLAIIVLLGALAWFFVETIPPRSLTLKRMTILRQRILQYAREHDRLPPALSDLPSLPDRDSSLLDGWKRLLEYRSDASQVVTLQSLGSDGKYGGSGDAQDLAGRFETRDPQGHWLEEANPWLQYPLDPAPERYEDLRARATAMGELPEGRVYEQRFSAALEGPLQAAIAACSERSRAPSSISLVFTVGENGFPQRIVPRPDDVVSICLSHRLTEIQFPEPPKADWLVSVTANLTK